MPHCNAPVAVDDMRGERESERERRGTERGVGGIEGEAGEGREVSDGVGGKETPAFRKFKTPGGIHLYTPAGSSESFFTRTSQGKIQSNE